MNFKTLCFIVAICIFIRGCNCAVISPSRNGVDYKFTNDDAVLDHFSAPELSEAQRDEELRLLVNRVLEKGGYQIVKMPPEGAAARSFKLPGKRPGKNGKQSIANQAAIHLQIAK